jgi:hypothetical protein
MFITPPFIIKRCLFLCFLPLLLALAYKEAFETVILCLSDCHIANPKQLAEIQRYLYIDLKRKWCET